MKSLTRSYNLDYNIRATETICLQADHECMQSWTVSQHIKHPLEFYTTGTAKGRKLILIKCMLAALYPHDTEQALQDSVW